MNLQNFTIKSQELIQQAQQLAMQSDHQQITNDHILKSMIGSDDEVIGYLLKKLNVNVNYLEQKIDEQLAKLPKVESKGGEYLSRDANLTIAKSQNYLKEFGDEFVSVEHILLGILASNDDVSKLLKSQGVTEKDLKSAIKELRKGTTMNSQSGENQLNALNKYAVNLNERAKSGKLDPVIGRDEEIRRVLHILSRRTKNNPILVGDPGVGKTAIAEGIAHRIVNGDVPENLKSKII